ncbi:MAG: diadenylate cyclase CdaA [Mangrovibacterium sp.]
MTSLFINIRFFDLLDILIVSFLLFYLYRLIKGTVAFNIFIGLFLLYFSWIVIRALNMELMETILGQFLGVGVIALIIVFQQEIRRFLLMIGSNEQISRFLRSNKFFQHNANDNNALSNQKIQTVVNSCHNMAKTKTGALIIIAKRTMLGEIIQTGEALDAQISDSLIETIFFKNSPLHDGAMIIVGNKIAAARCILPVSDRRDIDYNLGLRHRAAIGITEESDAIAIIVSEERGKISCCYNGELNIDLNKEELMTCLEKIVQPINKEESENGDQAK